ncbi:type II and III secretion system protein family protein [Afifella sp. JA880]|uniref:type II and III secretion system protein family protein n=1 Tax=Afifella sp. JA880 TaxID=2975280 RepID=UPI0021BB6985|nr:type II and III secretion system protein family protein [Afifella sp. JA880]MCT8268939.1 type II and III secretion system protein family protein [Afifella sp. JA880]
MVGHARIWALAVLTFVALSLPLAGISKAASDFPRTVTLSATGAAQNQPLRLGVNKSMVVELPRAAGDVLVSNPEIADAVLRTSTRLYLIGVKTGQANVFLFDAAGRQIASLDLYVETDLTPLNRLLRTAIPDAQINAEVINGSIVLTGYVPSSSASQKAEQIARSLIQSSSGGGMSAGSITINTGGNGGSSDDGPGIINLLKITGQEQVNLRVTIAEVNREIVKQLGINTQAVLQDGNLGFGAISNGAVSGVSSLSPFNFPINTNTDPASGGFAWNNNGNRLSASIKALEEASMLRNLAEPNLTAVSGETANFLVGGEFPVPVAVDEDGNISVAFKQFGVNLAFTPVVLDGGRISLKVRTEVSDLATEGSFSTAAGITIPGITVRRAETTVELPSGGAFAIAGLIQDETRRAVSGLPGLQHLPILGALFSSKDFLRSQTELVVIITPYVVKPVSPQKLARPDDNMAMANDAEAYFLGSLVKRYGAQGDRPTGVYAGQVGFSFD